MLNANLTGNLGNDPEMRYSQSGTAFLRFNVACNDRVRTPEGEWQDRTEWVRVSVIGQRAESLSNHLKKGTRVFVAGRLEARPWTTKDGDLRAGLELVASDVEFMSARQQDGDQDGQGWKPIQQPQQPAMADGEDLYELPF